MAGPLPQPGTGSNARRGGTIFGELQRLARERGEFALAYGLADAHTPIFTPLVLGERADDLSEDIKAKIRNEVPLDIEFEAFGANGSSEQVDARIGIQIMVRWGFLCKHVIRPIRPLTV